MSDIKQELFEAISIIVHSENEKLKFTKTIEAIVYDNSEASEGKYKVKYQDSIFTVYSNDVSLKYSVNDVVLVLIPEGDFSQQKIIVGKKGAAANQETASSTQDVLQKIDLIGPDWSSDNLGGYHDKISSSVGLIAGGEVKDFIIFDGFESQDSSQAKLFSNYLQKCHSFLIKADFRTNFPSDRIQEYYGGNYGIKVIFSQNDELYEYVLDLSNMTGDPYSYSVNSPQYIVFKYDNEALKNATLKRIELFQTDFNVVPQEFEDIFISNIQISFSEEIDSLDSGYSVNILTPQGNMISSNDITLTPQLKLNGVIVDYFSAMWFMRDTSVNVASKDYNSYAGLGWKQITGNENINKNTLILNTKNIGSKIYSSTELKAVITKDENTFSKIIEVFPLVSLYNFTMEAAFNDKVVSLSVEPANQLQPDYFYSWGKTDESGVSYALSTTGRTHVFNINEIYLNNTFYCSIYNKNGELLSTVKKTISKEITEENFSVIFTGSHFYCYDANGDIDINVANSEHQLGFELYDQNGEKVEVLSCEWIFPDSNLSMVSPVGKDLTLSTINYKIQSKYNVNRLNNTITLKVETYNNQSFEFKKEIVCLKTGNSGTNGTKYVAVLTFDSNAHSFVKKGDQIAQTAVVNLNVYEDGVSVSSADYTYSWSILGKDKDTKLIDFIGTPTATQAVVAYNGIYNDISEENALLGSSIVEVVVKIGGYKVEALKAIPVVLAGDYNNSIDWIDFVEYNPAGEEPVYNKNASIPKDWQINSFNTTETDDNPIYFKSNRIRVFESPTVYTNKKLAEFNYELDYSLIPVDKYNNSGKSGNVILNKNETSLLWPVIFWINTYGNESINGWDGVSTVINEKDGYILSPVVGAGEKDDATNLFTGVLMGTVGYYSGNSLKKSTGLFGFDEGVQTFNIDSETGNVRLGAPHSGGIEIDSEKSILSTYDFTEASIEQSDENYYTLSGGKGSKIDLNSGNIYTPQFVIKDGNAYFSGNLSGANGSFSGKIQASSGSIGGWSIQDGYLRAGTSWGDGYLELNGNKGSIEAPNFSLSNEGIKASEGNIGGWTINSDGLSGTDTFLYPKGGFKFGRFGAYGTTNQEIDFNDPTIQYFGDDEGDLGFDAEQGYIWAGWNGQFGAGASKYRAYISSNDGSVRARSYQIWKQTDPKDEWAGEWIPFNGSGSEKGNVTYDIDSFIWGFSDGSSVKASNINGSSAISWNHMLYVVGEEDPETKELKKITGIRHGNMHFERGLLNDTSSETGGDALEALKKLLGGGSGNVKYSGNTWTLSEAGADTTVTVAGMNNNNHWSTWPSVLYYDPTRGLLGATMDFKHGLLDSDTSKTGDDKIVGKVASAIAGYL